MGRTIEFPSRSLEPDAATKLRVICALYKISKRQAISNAVNLYAKKLGVDITVNTGFQSMEDHVSKG